MDGFALGFKKTPEHTGFGDKRVDELDFGNVTDIPRTRADWVLAKEKSPRVFSTETIQLIMPNFELSNQEAKALRVFVLSFTEQNLSVEYGKTFWTPDDPYLAGMRTIETFNCIGCHKIGLVKKPLELTEDLPTQPKDFTSPKNLPVFSDQQIINTVTHGGPREQLSFIMPSWGNILSAEEIELLRAHLRVICRCKFDPEAAAKAKAEKEKQEQ